MGKHVFAHASSCSTGKRMFAHVAGLRCALEKLFLVSDNSEAQLRKMHFFFGKRSEFRGKVTCPKGESTGFIGTQRNSIGISKAVP